jgi:hypothetical protein
MPAYIRKVTWRVHATYRYCFATRVQRQKFYWKGVEHPASVLHDGATGAQLGVHGARAAAARGRARGTRNIY